MQQKLTFLHTAPVHVATFDRLVAAIDPSIPVHHVVREDLLRDARAAGSVTPALAERIDRVIATALEQSAVVVCTCSTIGGCAEQAGDRQGRVVQRVDRAMAERAVMLGQRIVVMAALASTLEPTRELLRDAARRADRSPELIEVLCEAAWAKFEQGNSEGYLREIAWRLRQVAPQGDVVVLAQASMAGAADLCPDLNIPILSSPHLGAEAAVAAFRHVIAQA